MYQTMNLPDTFKKIKEKKKKSISIFKETHPNDDIRSCMNKLISK